MQGEGEREKRGERKAGQTLLGGSVGHDAHESTQQKQAGHIIINSVRLFPLQSLRQQHVGALIALLMLISNEWGGGGGG